MASHEMHPRCMINLSRAIDKRFYECYNIPNIRILLGVLILSAEIIPIT